MLEIWGDAGDSSTKLLWRGGERGGILEFSEMGVYPKWGVLTPLRTILPVKTLPLTEF